MVPMTRPLTNAMGSTTDLDFIITLRAAFFGFSISAILFGITVQQGYQYFAYTMVHDSFFQISVAGAACLLDTLNLAFGMNLVYCYTLQVLGYTNAGCHVVGNLKALAVTHVLLILLIQGHYLTQIWLFSCRETTLLKKSYILCAKIYVITAVILGAAIATVFLMQIPSINTAFSFSLRLECFLYLGLGATAVFDCTTAAAMCLMLYECGPDSDTVIGRKMQRMLHDLVKYFVGTGLMTSFVAIMAIIMYVVRPHTMLYLAMEFSATRLYANAILANFNTRPSRRQRADGTADLNMEVLATSRQKASGSSEQQQANPILNSSSALHRLEFLLDDHRNESEFGDGSQEQPITSIDSPSGDRLGTVV